MYDTPEELDAFFDALYDFRLERFLGAGAFGVAVLALDETEKVKKVFKLPKDERTTEALKVEGKNLRKLENLMSPNIIRLHKYGRARVTWQGREEERYYLCLAFGGTSLRHRLGDLSVEYDSDANPIYRGSGTRLPAEEALRIAIDISHGLEAAHGFRDSEVRIIHRDIKPENILIDDETGVARITDFGISRVVDRSTGICSIAGTLLYMDPECFKGHAGTYSDLYSLGIVMYEMFTGQLPFADFSARMTAPANDPRQWNPDLPNKLAEIILRAIDNDLARRYKTATEILADLKAVSASLNPLPPEYDKLADRGGGLVLCEDKQSHQRVLVHLVETKATLADVAQETAAIEALKIPAIVVPLRHFLNEHILGIVCAPPKGRPLIDVLGQARASQTERLKRFCELMAAVCDTVETASSRGVMHGHLSPHHVYCEGTGGISLCGYGLAPAFRLRRPGAEGAQTIIKAFRNDLAYMSPQLLEGRAPAPQDDVFSLGSLMYTLLAEQPYADLETLERLARGETVAQTTPNPREKNALIPRRLASLIAKAIDWNEHNRPATAGDMATGLRQCTWPDDIIDTLTEEALRMYENGAIVAAYDQLNKALDADPGNPHVHYTRGMIYYREKEYKWAAEELQKSANVLPTFEVLVLLGKCLADWGGRHEQANEAFSHALDYGDSPEVRCLLALSLHEQGQTDEAKEYMRQSIDLETDESIRKKRQCYLSQWDPTKEQERGDS